MKTTYPTVTCHVCGKTQEACYVNPTRQEMVDNQLCFGCHYWKVWIANRVSLGFVTEEYEFFCIGQEDDRAFMRGFGGRFFLVEEIATGKRFASTNLWNGSQIPPEFRSMHCFKPTHRIISMNRLDCPPETPRHYSDGLHP